MEQSGIVNKGGLSVPKSQDLSVPQYYEMAPTLRESVARVLVVEDDLSLHPFWQKIFSLSPHPVRVDWTNRAEDAENLIRLRYRNGQPFYLVIVDIFLDGPATGVDLWNRYGEETQNFIFASTMPAGHYKSLMAKSHGCPIFLQKPLSLSNCFGIVDTILEKQFMGNTNKGEQ